MATAKDFDNDPCDCEALRDELASCREAKHEECRQENEKTKQRLEALQKKLIVMQIAVAVGATVIGKDLLDKIMDQLAAVEKVQDRITNDGKQEGGNDGKVSAILDLPLGGSFRC